MQPNYEVKSTSVPFPSGIIVLVGRQQVETPGSSSSYRGFMIYIGRQGAVAAPDLSYLARDVPPIVSDDRGSLVRMFRNIPLVDLVEVGDGELPGPMDGFAQIAHCYFNVPDLGLFLSAYSDLVKVKKRLTDRVRNFRDNNERLKHLAMRLHEQNDTLQEGERQEIRSEVRRLQRQEIFPQLRRHSQYADWFI